MSHNNKNARNLAKARAITLLHKNGEKGPAKTNPQHGKKWTYRGNPDAMKKLNEFVKGPEPTKEDKTSAKKILSKAGRAALAAAQEGDA